MEELIAKLHEEVERVIIQNLEELTSYYYAKSTSTIWVCLTVIFILSAIFVLAYIRLKIFEHEEPFENEGFILYAVCNGCVVLIPLFILFFSCVDLYFLEHFPQSYILDSLLK